MHVSRIQQTHRNSTFRWLVVVCLALVAITATAQAVHYHPDQVAGAASHCSLCLVMHSAVAVTHSAEISFSFQTSTYLPMSEDSQRQSASTSFALFSRPPPLV